ncbi:MAG TPA: chemotaxis protein CheB [Steroidobacteraceae bacterium]|jgi:two-component system chemotaxis response regulator CheB|nr:chemotaxis protein CheB [Steroidobacteraceae bacterium]
MSDSGNLRGRIDAIVVGASAGGIEALMTLLPPLPATFGVPIFVVVHLPRGRPSLLTDIFVGRCSLLVCEAQDKEPVRPGTVYFAPPDYHLLIDEGPQLALSTDDPVHHSRPSIDVLFESAADIYGSRLLGIILSGANEDGAAGLAAVAAAGGVTMVQRPDSAPVKQMVVAALNLSPASHVLELNAMSSLLLTLNQGATL